MKKSFVAIGLVSLLLTLSGCGVADVEYVLTELEQTGNLGDFAGGTETPSNVNDSITTKVPENTAEEDISEVLSDYSGISIVEAFIQNGMDPSFKNRRNYAKTAGIEDYIGSAEQNVYLIEYMGGSLEKKTNP